MKDPQDMSMEDMRSELLQRQRCGPWAMLGRHRIAVLQGAIRRRRISLERYCDVLRGMS